MKFKFFMVAMVNTDNTQVMTVKTGGPSHTNLEASQNYKTKVQPWRKYRVVGIPGSVKVSVGFMVHACPSESD